MVIFVLYRHVYIFVNHKWRYGIPRWYEKFISIRLMGGKL